MEIMVLCRQCKWASPSPEDFPRAQDRLRECPKCGSVDLAGLPGIFRHADQLKQARVARQAERP